LHQAIVTALNRLDKDKADVIETPQGRPAAGPWRAHRMMAVSMSIKEYHDDMVKGIITKVVALSADRIRVTFDNNIR